MSKLTEVPVITDVDVGSASESAPESAPASVPPSYPTAPLTRTALAQMLGISESTVRKRLKQLGEFHEENYLVETCGDVSVLGAKAVIDLGVKGVQEYRKLQVAKAQEPFSDASAITVYQGGTIVPATYSTGIGADEAETVAITTVSFLEKRRLEIEERRLALEQRRASRNQYRWNGRTFTSLRSPFGPCAPLLLPEGFC